MTMTQSLSQSDKALVQLKRIRGQLDGVISMYEDERTCVDIVRQIIAARSSLGRVARDLLTGEANRCSQERRIGDLDAVLKEIFRY
jgi:DNA-binding FrmR family transcriptional regulator